MDYENNEFENLPVSDDEATDEAALAEEAEDVASVPENDEDISLDDILAGLPGEEAPSDEPESFEYHMAGPDVLQDDVFSGESIDSFEDDEEPQPHFGAFPAGGRPQTPPPAPSPAPQPQTNYRAPGQTPPPVQPYNFNRPSYSPPAAPQPPKKKSNGGLIALLVIILVSVVIAAAFLIPRLGSSRLHSATTDTSASLVTNEAGEPQTTEATSSPVQYASTNSGTELSAVEIAEKCRASIVGVMTYQNGQLSGEGSGVVMGVDSTKTYTYIMTCAHVIASSKVTYGILTLDGMSYEAELVGYDTKTDIGVLKVKDTSLAVAEFGDSTQLKIGETVYAIGNPGGSEYFGSMTEGIVSAIDRTVSGAYNLTSIQHDAAINPGNSGGALVNSKGQVVGINSSKIAATDYEGMGFAVPTSTAVSIANSLISYGYVPNRPKLGITYAAVSEYQVYSMVVAIKGLPSGSLIITGINSDSALAGTDAQVGDMIIAVNGKKMDSSSVLLDLIDKGAVGDSLTLTLCRVNSRTYQTTSFDVTIKLVEDKGSETEQSTEEDSIYDFNNGGSSGSDFGGDFRDFFRDYFGF